MIPAKKITFHKHIDDHKKNVLIMLLIFTAVGGIVFATINFLRGMKLLPIMELMAACISLLLLFYLKNTNNVKQFRLIAFTFVIMFCSIMLVAFFQIEISITVFAFVLLVPLLTNMLLGSKTGLILTTIFLFLSGIIFLYKYSNHEAFNHPAAIANIATVTLLVWGFSFSYERANERYKESLIFQASKDFLTNLYNRSMLKEVFKIKLDESQENNSPLSMLVGDLDGFKQINDNHGHDVGDQVIKQFAEILKLHSGQHGSCFRLGGEEFCVIFSQTNQQLCQEIAERIRRATEQIDINSEQGKVNVTVSIGVTECSNHQCSITHLLKETDKKCITPKHWGATKCMHKHQICPFGNLNKTHRYYEKFYEKICLFCGSILIFVCFCRHHRRQSQKLRKTEWFF